MSPLTPRSRPLLLACLALGSMLLAACARSVDPAGPGTPGAGGSGPADQPVTSDLVSPVGGDLRRDSPWYLLGGTLPSSSDTPTVTMTFGTAQVGGRAYVNAWSAPYTATPSGGLTLGPIAATRMAGPPEAMAAEQEFLDLLATVDGYAAVQAGELYLFDGDRNVLTFSATPAQMPTVSASTTALAARVVGMSQAQARRAVEAAGRTFRVVSRDGEALVVTDDYRTDRINATVVDGTVTSTTVG